MDRFIVQVECDSQIIKIISFDVMGCAVALWRRSEATARAVMENRVVQRVGVGRVLHVFNGLSQAFVESQCSFSR